MKNSNVLLLIGSSVLILVGFLFIGLTSAKDEDMREQSQKRIELKQKTSTTTKKISFKIDDRTEICTGERELIYTNSQFNYYLPCYKSTTIYLVYSDHEVTLREALDTNSVTIDELINNGLDITRETV